MCFSCERLNGRTRKRDGVRHHFFFQFLLFFAISFAFAFVSRAARRGKRQLARLIQHASELLLFTCCRYGVYDLLSRDRDTCTFYRITVSRAYFINSTLHPCGHAYSAVECNIALFQLFGCAYIFHELIAEWPHTESAANTPSNCSSFARIPICNKFDIHDCRKRHCATISRSEF